LYVLHLPPGAQWMPRSHMANKIKKKRTASWQGLFDAASELKKVKVAVASLAPQGFVASSVRPALSAVETQLENEALKSFGLFGRLALSYKTQSAAAAKFDSPVKVLAYALHSAVISLGFVVTGTNVNEFSQSEEWPNFIPAGFLTDGGGTAFTLRYRTKSQAADKLVVRGLLQGENLVVTCSDPYTSGDKANVVHLRLKDFVKANALVEAKERELLAVVEERVISAASVTKTQPTPRPSALAAPPPSASLQLPMAYAVDERGTRSGARDDDFGPGFHGDLVPGVGGSMLFGPGNPQFDRGGRPLHQGDSRTGLPRGAPHGARYDPVGPFVTGNGEPDNDDEPMPGGNRYI